MHLCGFLLIALGPNSQCNTWNIHFLSYFLPSMHQQRWLITILNQGVGKQFKIETITWSEVAAKFKWAETWLLWLISTRKINAQTQLRSLCGAERFTRVLNSWTTEMVSQTHWIAFVENFIDIYNKIHRSTANMSNVRTTYAEWKWYKCWWQSDWAWRYAIYCDSTNYCGWRPDPRIGWWSRACIAIRNGLRSWTRSNSRPWPKSVYIFRRRQWKPSNFGHVHAIQRSWQFIYTRFQSRHTVSHGFFCHSTRNTSDVFFVSWRGEQTINVENILIPLNFTYGVLADETPEDSEYENGNNEEENGEYESHTET